MAKHRIKFVFRDNPDGSRTDIDSYDFFGCTSPYTQRWNTADKERFHEERIAIEKGEVKYFCGGCCKPVVLRGRKIEEGVTMFFRHKGDAPKDCPFEDGRLLSEQQMRALKYKGKQESLLHEKLKCFIAAALEDEGFEVDVEKTKKINQSQSRRPDVLAHNPLTQQNIVFEIQMSTTFLNVVVGRMSDYSSIDYSVIWVFNRFEPEVYTTKDTYQFQNNNIFILDDEMMDLSLKNNKLTFRVYYLEYEDVGSPSPKSGWKNTIVTLADLTFGSKRGVYFFDSKKSRDQIISIIEQRERTYRNMHGGLSKISSLERLDQAEIDAIVTSSDEDIDDLIKNSIKLGLYGEITHHNITSLFQWLEILKQRAMNIEYEEFKSVIKNEIVYNDNYQNCHVLDWDGFNILNHPSIIEDTLFIFSIYHLGYWPEEIDAEDIEKTMRDEYKNTHRDKKAPETFLHSLTHYFLLKITKESSNIRERKELITFYLENYSFISCIIAVTMRRFVEHDFSNLIGFCNYVWNHCKSYCATFLRIMDNSKIDPSEYISKKGVDHYSRIKKAAQGQGISHTMSRLMSILIPKVWDSKI
ncbi:MAG: competence protein CoiA family protein [Bacteroidales bacterium]|nr:competence protein CoiA family protein [Bacteroidales bacterium]